MELEKINIDGVNDTYALSVVKKEFKDAVNEPWKEVEPWQGYQKKLVQDLAVLDLSKEKAIDLPQFEKLSGEDNLYCIHRPRSKKNIRIIYTIYVDCIILYIAFLEKNSGDYQRAIRTAKKRLKWLESDYD